MSVFLCVSVVVSQSVFVCVCVCVRVCVCVSAGLSLHCKIIYHDAIESNRRSNVAFERQRNIFLDIPCIPIGFLAAG